MFKSIVLFIIFVFSNLALANDNICHRIYFDYRHLLADELVTRAGTKPTNFSRYQVRRPLLSYLLLFDFLFQKQPLFSLSDDLVKLGPEGVVVDFGSGEGFAVEQIKTLDAAMMIDQLEYMNLTLEMGFPANFYDYSLRASFYNNFRMQSGKILKPGDAEFSPSSKSPEINVLYSRFWQRILNYAQKPKDQRPRSIGITYEMSRDLPADSQQQYLVGRLFEEIPSEEIPLFDIGMANFGIPSYTKQMSETLSKMLQRCKLKGRIYIFGSAARVFTGSSRNEKNSVLLSQYLRNTSSGIRILIDPENPYKFMIEKVSERVVIPKLEYVNADPKLSAPPMYYFSNVGALTILSH